MRNSVRPGRTLHVTAAALGLLTLGLTAGTFLRPALAQNDPANPNQPPPDAPRGRMIMGGPTSVAASGDYVYIVRGNTLYQMKASDLSLVTQKELPALAPPERAANP